MHIALTFFVFWLHARAHHGCNEKLLCSLPAFFSDQTSMSLEMNAESSTLPALVRRRYSLVSAALPIPYKLSLAFHASANQL